MLHFDPSDRPTLGETLSQRKSETRLTFNPDDNVNPADFVA